MSKCILYLESDTKILMFRNKQKIRFFKPTKMTFPFITVHALNGIIENNERYAWEKKSHKTVCDCIFNHIKMLDRFLFWLYVFTTFNFMIVEMIGVQLSKQYFAGYHLFIWLSETACCLFHREIVYRNKMFGVCKCDWILRKEVVS